MKTNRIAQIGLLIGEPARASMLLALMDGRALTAAELARCAGVTAQTASSHLGKLVEAGLLSVEKQGRHRYHRLASVETARLLESVMQIAGDEARAGKPVVTGPRDRAMREARTCYDHFAGRLGVAIADSLLAGGHVEFADDGGLVTAEGASYLAGCGIQLPTPADGARPGKRPLCRPCLDWSERRPHVAGIIGAAICDHYLGTGLVRRIDGSWALHVTPGGRAALYEMFGIRSLQ